MAERVRVREIDDDEGRRLLRITRRGTGSVVTWRPALLPEDAVERIEALAALRHEVLTNPRAHSVPGPQ
ncbi:hypothetical protein [Streptomyces sp. NPDC127038]|uniref:hypothetical protein n=1 Tax=Streptomyces sp. NPDC127038 TaxID=3347114 RepID=UPI003665AD39